MKTTAKKIALHRDTLRHLEAPLLARVGAGATVAVNSVCATCSCHVDCTFRVTCTA